MKQKKESPHSHGRAGTLSKDLEHSLIYLTKTFLRSYWCSGGGLRRALSRSEELEDFCRKDKKKE